MTNKQKKKKENPSMAQTTFTIGIIYCTGGLPKIDSGCPIISIKAETKLL